MIGLASAPETAWLRRVPTGAKLGALAAAGFGLFLVDAPWAMAGLAVGAAILQRSVGRSTTALARDLAWPVAILAFVLAANAAFGDLEPALVAFLRLLTLLFLAHAVTLTTTTAELMAAIEAGLAPLDRRGLVDAARISLVVTLAIRFIPVIAEEAREIRDAQAARGLAAHPLALAVPLAVRVLVRAEAVADAVESRGFGQSPSAAARRPPLATEDRPS